MVAPFPDTPTRIVTSADGTPIAVFSAGAGPALLLVHGTTADHRTWRVVARELATRHGAFLIAWSDDLPIGCVSVRPLAPTVGEVKRLWVDPAARGVDRIANPSL